MSSGNYGGILTKQRAAEVDVGEYERFKNNKR
jgi:hypothetical protein